MLPPTCKCTQSFRFVSSNSDIGPPFIHQKRAMDFSMLLETTLLAYENARIVKGSKLQFRNCQSVSRDARFIHDSATRFLPTWRRVLENLGDFTCSNSASLLQPFWAMLWAIFSESRSGPKMHAYLGTPFLELEGCVRQND